MAEIAAVCLVNTAVGAVFINHNGIKAAGRPMIIASRNVLFTNAIKMDSKNKIGNSAVNSLLVLLTDFCLAFVIVNVLK
ncbi:hypothetical protein GCM10009111_32570 [Colwellia asteriadis]|uniref:Uncharacterized protein n=1 Tax=Colwellia asteriadis TaxID=517723 RepID=A0ABP3WL41_9GAMM